ncbi:MAG: diguanylate cyclase [Thermodesulfobacteriota bacterium]|nr:diguanylate cyclase [Thermodesulfobacteriota bacterium]
MSENDFKILLVEDSRTQALRLQFMLQSHGFESDVAINGCEALEKLNEQYYPIIITDWVMPEMDGAELCRTIRSRPFTGYVFIFLVTSKDDPADIVAGLGAGADDYLTKPVSELELIARLSTAKRVIELERSLKKRNEEVLHLSVTDALTNIHNRSYYNSHFPAYITRALRSGNPLSVVMCDIDHFKNVNDTYGHLAGDAVLKAFAACLKGLLRVDVDLLVRYGGEEFVALLPETNADNAVVAAQRMRQAIEELMVDFEDETLDVTASFGVGTYDPSGQERQVTVEQMMMVADDCLYKAKREGRNCVRSAML